MRHEETDPEGLLGEIRAQIVNFSQKCPPGAFSRGGAETEKSGLEVRPLQAARVNGRPRTYQARERKGGL